MMEEQEKIDIREHLIGWIDSFFRRWNNTTGSKP